MVGRALLRRLLAEESWTKIGAVHFRDHTGLPANARLEWVRANLMHYEACQRVAEGYRYAIMGAATTSGSLGVLLEPWRSINDNVIMNSRMLEAFQNKGVQRVIFISSGTVYPEIDGVIREDQLDLNADPYQSHMGVAWGIRFIEKLCQFCRDRFGMEIIIVRASNIYGPYSTFDPVRSNVIPALIRKAVDQMDPYEVWGSPYVERDFLYVDDFADVVLRLLGAEHIKFGIFNVGMGQQTSVGKIVEYILEAAGHSPSEVRYTSKAPDTIRTRILDCSRIKAAVHWVPSHTMKEGIGETAEWWRSNRKLWEK